jgi:2-polyprenyl-6-methoxyphenol hydroxylase-like FAD-dependent oxidoreductase
MALVGAYILAGEIATKPDFASAFEAYEKLMRPFAEMNQALVETGKSIMIPDTQQELEARNEMLRKMAEQPIGKTFRKDDSRQAHRQQVHSALTLPDYS